MKSLKNIITLTLLAALVFACKDFEELESNQNRPTTVPASLIFNGVLNEIDEAPWSLEHRQNQYWCCNYNYYGTNEYWSSASLSFMTLKNIIKMEDEALRSGAAEINPYTAIGKFLRALFYTRMTQRVGDLPLDEALKGLENDAPAYNTQKEVYVQILTWLEESNAQLAGLIAASDNSLAGDFYFNNDLEKWQKLVNTYTLRVLISLSKKADDPDLNVKARFKSIIDNPSTYPKMTKNNDKMLY